MFDSKFLGSGLLGGSMGATFSALNDARKDKNFYKNTLLGGTTGGLGAIGINKLLGNTMHGSDYGTAFGAGIGSALGPLGAIAGGALGNLITGAFHKSSSSKKKKKSYRTAKKYINNAGDLLNKQYDLGEDNSDLLGGYQNYLADQYKDNKKYFYKQKEQNLLDNYLNDLTSKNQSSLNNAFNKTFTGYGTTNDYLNNAWNYNYDNDFNTNYINDIYNDVLGKVDSAKARGYLNDAGYSKALDLLNTRKSAGLSQLNALTDDVIKNYRDDLANTAGNIKTAIDNYSLSDRNSLNMNNLTNGYNNLLQSQQESIGNDLNNAVLNYTPFNASDILAEARNSQGMYNTNNDPELLASLQEQAENKSKKIGLGNQGIF